MKLADRAGANLPEGVAVFDYPQARRVRLCTTNGLGRINRELKRRTRVVSMFPNTASCLRLVSALLTGRRGVDERKNLSSHETLQPNSDGIAREIYRKEAALPAHARQCALPRHCQVGGMTQGSTYRTVQISGSTSHRPTNCDQRNNLTDYR